MKTLLKKTAIMTNLIIAFVCISTTETQAQTKWMYKMTMNDVTYKIYFEWVNGTISIQLYSSQTNKWSFATILAQNSDNSNGQTTYYKIKENTTGMIYELWSMGSPEQCIVKTNGGTWTYMLESKS